MRRDELALLLAETDLAADLVLFDTGQDESCDVRDRPDRKADDTDDVIASSPSRLCLVTRRTRLGYDS